MLKLYIFYNNCSTFLINHQSQWYNWPTSSWFIPCNGQRCMLPSAFDHMVESNVWKCNVAAYQVLIILKAYRYIITSIDIYNVHSGLWWRLCGTFHTCISFKTYYIAFRVHYIGEVQLEVTGQLILVLVNSIATSKTFCKFIEEMYITGNHKVFMMTWCFKFCLLPWDQWV